MKHPRVLLILVLLSGIGSAAIVAAQDDAPAGRETAAPSSDDDDEEADEDSEDADAEATMREEDGSKVKVFRFSGLDISGRLKSPQLLYFLNRLRAEFDRPKLPHRSFMPELERSAKSRTM